MKWFIHYQEFYQNLKSMKFQFSKSWSNIIHPISHFISILPNKMLTKEHVIWNTNGLGYLDFNHEDNSLKNTDISWYMKKIVIYGVSERFCGDSCVKQFRYLLSNKYLISGPRIKGFVLNSLLLKIIIDLRNNVTACAIPFPKKTHYDVIHNTFSN